MDKRSAKRPKPATSSISQEVSSIEWEYIKMTQQEEDLINIMYRLVGDRWDLIAGRIPGRKAEEIERFWLMKHDGAYVHIMSEYELQPIYAMERDDRRS